MKKIRLTAVTVLLAMVFAGCMPNSLESYKQAVEKTEAIGKGQTTIAYTMAMDFNTEGMTEEQIKKLNYFKNSEGTYNIAFDDAEGKMIARNYLNMGGLGFDLDLYKNGEEIFIKMPVIGKYLKLDEFIKEADADQKAMEDMRAFISKDTAEALGKAWVGTLKQEDVLVGKQIILTTPDGEVKATQYTMKLKDEQIKALVSAWTDILSKDEKLKEVYENYVRKNTEDLSDTSFEKLFESIKENLETYQVENFEYNAYVDIDGYIVNETIGLEIKIKSNKPGSMTGLSYRLETKNWDINKEQKFEFPELTEENTLDPDELDQSLPAGVEINLFGNKE